MRVAASRFKEVPLNIKLIKKNCRNLVYPLFGMKERWVV